MAAPDAQSAVDVFFKNDAANWQAIYEQTDIFGVIYQHRHRLALDWVQRLGLAPGSRVLEVGCGAGLLAVAMATSGFNVVATDSTQAMLELARANAERAGVHVSLAKLDVHRLVDVAQGYDLVVALGVIPWLHSPEIALAEMSRVLRPGGHVIVSADNSARLQSLIDPLLSPQLVPARKAAKWILQRGRGRPRAATPLFVKHSTRQFDLLLAGAGFEKIRGLTFGFGPFTFFGRRLLRDKASLRVHQRLQAMADRGVPLVRLTGAQYIVLAQKGALQA